MEIRVVGGPPPKRTTTTGFAKPIEKEVEYDEPAKGVGAGGAYNKIRDKIFKKTSLAINPDRKEVRRYEKFLGDQYEIVLKKELDRTRRKSIKGTRGSYSGVGYATGNLKKRLKAGSIVKIKKSLKKGVLEIGFQIKVDFSDVNYGASLAEDRKPKVVAYRNILAWVYQKISNGTFKVGSAGRSKIKQGATLKTLDAANKTIDKQIAGIAVAIMTNIEKNARPPVIKDWYKFNKNKRLRIQFKRATKRKGAYYRTRIKKSIIKNINNKA